MSVGTTVTIIEAAVEHASAIADVTRAGFQGGEEVELIQRLHADGLVVLSLVAFKDEELVGHILFSVLDVAVDGRKVKTVALAPMSVSPKLQSKGVGAALIREGLKRLGERGLEAVIVLGHPRYYPRFGFSSELAAKFPTPFRRESFMALELVPGALTGARGDLTYPKAFGLR